jgi:hypothetical protein
MDEVAYIARQSEGAWNPEWIMKQPILIRKRYRDALEKEAKKREAQSKVKQ